MSPKSRGRNQKPGRSRPRKPSGAPGAGPPDLARAVAEALAPALSEPTPLLAESLMSDLLGRVWAGIHITRTEGVEEFAGQLVADTVQMGAVGRPILELLARIAPPEVAAEAAKWSSRVIGEVAPWTPLLDTVELVDAWSSQDIFGDQTNYILLFGYRQAGRVVGRHVVIALVDHNLHLLKDAFLVEGVSLEQLAEVYEQDPDLYVYPVPDLAWAAGDITRAMDRTDVTIDVVDMLGERTAQTWYLLRSRVRTCLPAPAAALAPFPQNERDKEHARFMRAKITKDFLATEMDGLLPDRETVSYLAHLFIDYACDYGRGAPDRWSPIAVELFLLDFAPRKVLWEAEDVPWVAPTLKVFTEWAQKRRSVAVRGRRATQAAIDRFSGDFVFAALGGTEPSVSQSFAQGLLAAGVDLSDKAAMDAYVAEYNRRQQEGG